MLDDKETISNNIREKSPVIKRIFILLFEIAFAVRNNYRSKDLIATSVDDTAFTQT